MLNYTKRTLDLLESDPPAIMDGYDYFERPDSGWSPKGTYFTGVGYHGPEIASLNSNWREARAGLGHMPDGGYEKMLLTYLKDES